MDSHIHITRYELDIIRILASAGADLDAVNKAGNTSLTLASVYGYDEVVKLLLEYGADVDKKRDNGTTPLMLASEHNLTNIVKILLDAGADVNVKDKYNRTALMNASNEGQIDVIKILINHGAHVNTQDSDGGTALIYASSGFYGRYINVKTKNNDVFLGSIHPSSGTTKDVVKLLIDHGANVNMKDERGRTALNHATDQDIINLLRQAGAEK